MQHYANELNFNIDAWILRGIRGFVQQWAVIATIIVLMASIITVAALFNQAIAMHSYKVKIADKQTKIIAAEQDIYSKSANLAVAKSDIQISRIASSELGMQKRSEKQAINLQARTFSEKELVVETPQTEFQKFSFIEAFKSIMN